MQRTKAASRPPETGSLSRVVRKDKKELPESTRVLNDPNPAYIMEQLHTWTQHSVRTVTHYLGKYWKAALANAITGQLHRSSHIATPSIERLGRVQW